MKFLAVLLLPVVLASTAVVAGPCYTGLIHPALEPLTTDPTYIACETESNYTLRSINAPSSAQASAICASSACQTVLKTIVADDILPHCEVDIPVDMSVYTVSLVDLFVYFASLLFVAFQMTQASTDAAEKVTTETNAAPDNSTSNGTYYVLEKRCCLDMVTAKMILR
ncbi:hypothetical protein PHYBOEH_009006 [Phytophthora boehmeriae]|uniref:Elicitin n=1 Tax=Phytophthora boehmeriae TaxID=109152 RepID=A0A8T1W0Q3_9STRA|nr:hypothetical protein PHYBOEH_009006 [Phytophthora boehmeriae]